MLQTGLLSITFRKLSPEEIVQLVEQAGLDGIEWGSDIHVPAGDLETAGKVRALTESAGLQTLAYGSYYRSEPTADPQTDFAPVLASASELGAPLIRVWAGTLGSADLTSKGRKNLIEHSRVIASMAEERGIRVASEYHNGTVTDTPESALDFIGEVNHPNYKTLWQPPVGMPFDQALKALKGILPHVDNVHVFHWWPEVRDRLPLAEGASRWEAYLDVLRSTGRNHACLLEFVKDDSPEQFLEDAETLKALVKGT